MFLLLFLFTYHDEFRLLFFETIHFRDIPQIVVPGLEAPGRKKSEASARTRSQTDSFFEQTPRERAKSDAFFKQALHSYNNIEVNTSTILWKQNTF